MVEADIFILLLTLARFGSWRVISSSVRVHHFPIMYIRLFWHIWLIYRPVGWILTQYCRSINNSIVYVQNILISAYFSWVRLEISCAPKWSGMHLFYSKYSMYEVLLNRISEKLGFVSQLRFTVWFSTLVFEAGIRKTNLHQSQLNPNSYKTLIYRVYATP